MTTPNSKGAIRCEWCGDLGWTVEKYGRVTHKRDCPHRTDPWHQADPQSRGASIQEVYWADDPTRTRQITSGCSRCGVDVEDILAREVVVSVAGKAHFAANYGLTNCGIDATGDDWWWPV